MLLCSYHGGKGFAAACGGVIWDLVGSGRAISSSWGGLDRMADLVSRFVSKSGKERGCM